jgi:hypothetical protein
VSARPPAPDAAERLYALLLRAYPASFRERFGAEMRQHFRDRRRDAAERGESAARFWLELAADSVRALPVEHLAALMERRRARSAHDPVPLSQDRAMTFRRILGALLLAGAFGHVVVDVTHPHSSMGGFAILLTSLMFAAGAVLLVYPRRQA